MVPYNTQLLPLKLPEYGRNIHQMIDYCVHIPDREERTRCAYTIAHIMESLFPELVTGVDGSRKVWDHINIIADFKLDIDFPCEVSSAEEMHPRPNKISYGGKRIAHRFYGRNIQLMIDRVAEMEDGEDKDALISMIAHHMKKLMLAHNREGVDDARILRDLAEYSKGRIVLDPKTYILHEFRDVTPVETQKKKKKK
ncbi:MAG TPA: DUF4290 domain-containing protein [Porphyromonadaceae bacterium]|nr:DUF4290 domain-containing protein [Porphyromonadaceae bacterium]